MDDGASHEAAQGLDAELPSSQFTLLGQRRFAPFFWTQFLGAGNDNVFKIAFTGLVTYQASLFPGTDPDRTAFLIAAIFIAPFVLFSATSGQIADKWEKSRLIRFVKALEIAIMLLGAAGFLTRQIALLYATTFMMGVHSTLFGPVKYAYLPQHLRPEELVGGNAMIEMGTFVAILVGTIVGGELAAVPSNGPVYIAVACVAIAALGRAVAGYVPFSPASDAGLKINWNPFTETLSNLRLAAQNRTVFLSLLGISWLWFFGATFLTSFFAFTKDVLGGDPQVVTLLLAVFSIGIGAGSLLCERLSGEKVEIGLVPFGSIGMSLFALDLFWTSHGLRPGPELAGIGTFLGTFAHWRVLADLLLLSMFAGFYSVPLYALIQSRCEATHRARIIAANNILNALFMIVSQLLALVLLGPLHFTLPELFLVTAVLNAFVAVYIYGLVPEFLMRFLAWLLIHTFYRVRGVHIERLPESGAAVLVCNHVSFVDAVVVMAESPRPIRFVMDHLIFRIPVLSFIFRTARAIPIASAKDDPATLERANREIDAALAAGDLVCIFPEGKITKTGELNPFRSGVAQIVARNHVPVYPMALRGLWGSFFSRFSGTAFASLPRPLRRGMLSRLELVVGPCVPPQDVTPDGLRAEVAALRGEGL
jgi:1-acyl-sn-glycerol-3-phosphate acyltransferase